jgi:hypothetical protein
MFGSGRPLHRGVKTILMVAVALGAISFEYRWIPWPDNADQKAARAVAIAYAESVWDGDRARALDLAVADQVNRRYVERELADAGSVRAFVEALTARFGRDAAVSANARELRMPSPCLDTAKLSRADVRIDRDSAILCQRGSEPGDENAIYQLKRVGVQWKVWEVEPDLDVLTEAMRAESTKLERAAIAARREAARDVSAGKYRSAREAKATLSDLLRRISADAGLRHQYAENQ